MGNVSGEQRRLGSVHCDSLVWRPCHWIIVASVLTLASCIFCVVFGRFRLCVGAAGGKCGRRCAARTCAHKLNKSDTAVRTPEISSAASSAQCCVHYLLLSYNLRNQCPAQH